MSSDPSERTIYVKNLDDRVDKETLEELFVQVGSVVSVFIKEHATPERTQQQNGQPAAKYAFVEFQDEESVLFSIEMLNEVTLFGRQLMISPRDKTQKADQFRFLQQKRTHSASEQIFDEQKFLDRVKPTCRRQFASVEILNKHVQLSDLHKTNVAAKIRELQQTQPSVSSSSRKNDSAYRDRANERRSLLGYDPSRLTGTKEAETDVKSTEAIAAYKAAVPLDDSNIGNKMLKSMGWSDGQGLGRNLQGIVNPVTAEQRVQGVGLGASGSKLDYGGGSRKDRLKQAAIQRFNEITDKE